MAPHCRCCLLRLRLRLCVFAGRRRDGWRPGTGRGGRSADLNSICSAGRLTSPLGPRIFCACAELLLPGRWDMADYNESRVDSFCNMFTYSNWTSLFTRELMDDLVRHTSPAPEPSLRCLTGEDAAVRTILGRRTSTRSGWGWTRSTGRRSPTRSWRSAST